jgi:hypothetical protein
VARLGADPAHFVHIVADVENIFSANFTAMVAEYSRRIVARKSKELFVFRFRHLFYS